MKKGLIWILMIFIGLVISGLIFFQFYWIKSSIIVKEQQFDQLIIRSLSEISMNIEKQEAVAQVLDRIDPAYIDTNLYRMEHTHGEDIPEFNNGPAIKLQHDIEAGDEADNFDSNSEIASKEGAKQSLFKQRPKKPKDEPSHESEIRLQYAKRKSLINSIIDNMFRFSPRVEDRINKQDLYELLKSTFHEQGIDLPFEFAVTKWNTMMAFKSKNFVHNDKIAYYKVKLFPDDFYSESNFLLLYFPDKNKSIFKSLGIMAFSSITLTLVLILAFTLTVFIIFRQKKLSEIRSDFVSNMTHELKTPISTISLASQMLTDSSIPNEAKNVFYLSTIISDESKKLGYQVEKVLQLAIFEKGNLELKFKICNIHEIITNVVNTFEIQMKHKNGKFSTRFNAGKHNIYADQVHMTNVFSNLVDNAIKYCNQNPEIDISTTNENGHLIIAVKDNGIGMNKQDIKRIFEKFYRIPTGNIHTVKGFGLGLSYVKKIVEEHNGYVEVDSQPYEGTLFKIYLPTNNEKS